MLRWAIIKYHLDWFILEPWQWNCRSVVMIQGQIPMRELEHTRWLTMAMGIDPVWPGMAQNDWPQKRTNLLLTGSPSLGRTRKSIENSCHVQSMRCGMSHLPRARLAPNMNNEHHDAHKLLNSFFYPFSTSKYSPPQHFPAPQDCRFDWTGASTMHLGLPLSFVPIDHTSQKPNQFCQLSLLWFQAFDCIVAHQ